MYPTQLSAVANRKTRWRSIGLLTLPRQLTDVNSSIAVYQKNLADRGKAEVKSLQDASKKKT